MGIDELHDQGFYDHLDLGICVKNQQTIDRISSVHGLDELYLHLSADALKLKLHSLGRIRELDLNDFDQLTFPIDFQSTAKSFVNLERLSFNKIKSEMMIRSILSKAQGNQNQCIGRFYTEFFGIE